MLQHLRDQSGKWFIKILFGAIVLSFLVWGIADVIKGMQSNRSITKVNGQNISYENYVHQLQRSISQIQQSAGGKVTREQLKAMGIHRLVLDNMINEKLIEDELNHLNLTVTDGVVKGTIHGMKNFQRDGVFDHQLFLSILNHNHTTELNFINEIRQNIITATFYGAMLDGAHLPPAYVNKIVAGLLSPHKFTAAFLPYKSVSLKGTPSEDDLTLYFEKNKDDYALPELRTITVMFVDILKLAEGVTITEEEAKNEYEKRVASYSTPERRLIKRFTVQSRKLAEEILAKINAGRPAKAILRDIPSVDYSEDLVEKTELPDDVQEILFTLPQGKTSDIVERPVGYTIYVVTRIDQAETKSYETVKDQIIRDLRMSRMSDEIKTFRDNIEDAIAAGEKLSEVAQKNNLKFQIFEDVSRKGGNGNGNILLAKTFSAESNETILQTAFELSEGQESPLMDIEENKAVIVGVDKVIASRVPGFDEVKKKVAENYEVEEKGKAAFESARSLTDNVHDIKTFIARSGELKYSITSGITLTEMDAQKFVRGDENAQKAIHPLFQNIPFQSFEGLFALKPNQSRIEKTSDGILIIMLEKIEAPSASAEDKKKLYEAIQTAYKREMSALLLEAIKSKAKISVNEELLQEVANHEG
jgi:peptidyl-prolyl cis-trans isomerase D